MNDLKFAFLGFTAVAVLTLSLVTGTNKPALGAEPVANPDWNVASPEDVGLDSAALSEINVACPWWKRSRRRNAHVTRRSPLIFASALQRLRPTSNRNLQIYQQP